MGSITASCGHKLKDDEECVDVIYKGESLDIPYGFTPALVYAAFCPTCAAKWKADGDLFASEAEADAWLDSAPIPESTLRAIEEDRKRR